MSRAALIGAFRLIASQGLCYGGGLMLRLAANFGKGKTIMKPTEIATALRLLIDLKRPAFISGPPGVGKSSVVAQVAATMDLPVIDLRTVLLDPVDLRGLPHVNGDGRAHWALPDFLPRDGAGVLFLDELPQAMPSTQSACSQLILDRALGDYHLPDGWAIVAAGNRDGDRAATNRMPTHIRSRMVGLDFEIDQDDWCTHALDAGYRTEVIAFIRFRPELLHAFDVNAKHFPCPRTWQFVSEILDANPAGDIEHALYSGCVGEGAAAEFTGFLRVFRSLPSIDAILMDPKGAMVPEDPATLYAVTSALARRASDANFGSIGTYANRLPTEFAAYMVVTAVKSAPAIQQTREFAEWMSKNSKVMI